MKFTKLFATAALATAAIFPARAAEWQDDFPSVGYGVQSVESQGAALTRYADFAPYVKDKLGAKLDVYLASQYAGVIQALLGDQIEFMHMGASGYAAAYLESDGNVKPLVTPKNPDGSIGYHSVLLVRADSEYKSLEDLKGATFAWADPNSTSGYLMPNSSLRSQGLIPEEHFGQVVFSGGHEQSVIGLMDGTYDAVVTWTNDPETHTRGGIHMMLQRGVIEKSDFRVLWSSPPIPNPVIAARADLPQDLVEDFQTMLLNLKENNEEIFRQVARGKSPGFQKVTQKDYAPIVEMRRQMDEW